MDDFQKLHETEHMLHFLSDAPYDEIRKQIEETLQEQVVGCVLKSIRTTSDPQWLTGGRRDEEDPDKMILTRTGVAFEFSLIVHEIDGTEHNLKGTYSWVGKQLDLPQDATQQVWFDLDATLEKHGSNGALKSRLYLEDA